MPDKSAHSLRNVLRVDASTCLLFGAALLAFASPLSAALGASTGLLRGVGAGLLACAAFMAFAAQNVPTLRWPVWGVVLGNASWVLGSALVVIVGFEQLPAWGVVAIIAQALSVVWIAELEFQGLRKLGARSSAALA